MVETANRGPLSGLNVVDFGWYYAGPMAGMLMADQGATVVRIVKPGGEELSEDRYRLLNRGKKLLELDLKTEEGKSAALALIREADVVIENFRPGVMKRLGLDYASVKHLNPGLIYLSLPGFASTDRDRAHLQAWEGVMNAACGGFTEVHWWRQLAGYDPVYTWVPMCSALGSMQGMIAVMAALASREVHGKGTVIEAPLVTGAVFGFLLGFVGRSPDAKVPEGPVEVPAFFKGTAYNGVDSEEKQLEKLSQPNKSLLGVFMRWYTCGDGRDLMVWAQNLQAADTFLKLLGIEKRLKSEGYQNAGPWVTGLDNNLMALSPEHHEHVSNVISEALLAKPAHEWETLLAEAGVAVAMIRTRDEWMSLDRAHKGGLFTEMNELTVPGQFADVSGPEGGSVTNSFAEPEDISLSDAVALFAAGAPKPAVQADAAPLKKGELLKSLKVLDLTNLVAGPTSTYTLAQYGAEVIKADPPRFVHPALIASSMLEANQGKRSILTDLTTAPGRDVFARLVKWADIVVHNSVDGVAERLGVTQAQLQAINPDVVVCQFSFLGGLHRGAGGLEGWSGFDSLVQGINGIMTHYGTLAYPQFHGQIICGDIMGGIGGTYAALLAIYQKRRTGYAGEARTSLARMINYMQLPGMIMKDGSSDQGEARGQFTLGEGPSARLYECADRWLYVEARGDGIAELNEFVTGTPDADEKALEAAFAEKPYGYWQAKLDALDIPCHLAATVADICAEGITSVPNEASDEVARGTVEVLVRPHHPAGRPILNLAPTWARIGEDQTYKRLTPALRYGDGTEAILKELGYGEEEIKDLIRLRVSHTHLPSMGSESAYFFEPENCK